MNSTADELQLIEKIKASYQDVISDLPPTEVLPRHVKFSEYCKSKDIF